MDIKVISVALVAIALRQAYAQNLTVGEPCNRTSECLPNVGLSCRFLINPCSKGTCACPDNQWFGATKCETPVTELWLGDACTADNQHLIQIDNAVCDSKSKKVVCESTAGVTRTDNLICKTDTQKRLGEKSGNSDVCIEYGDKIYRSPGRTTRNADYVCQCLSSYIQDPGTKYCRRKTLGDPCRNSGQCPRSNQRCSLTCTCSRTHREYKGACIETGSASIGERCTGSSGSHVPYNERATTCSPELSCTRCPEDDGRASKRCLKVHKYQESGSSQTYPAVFHLVAAIFVGICGRRMI